MSFRGFLYVLSWISLCPFVDFFMSYNSYKPRIYWLFSIRNQVSNQECNQVGNQVYQSRDNAAYGR